VNFDFSKEAAEKRGKAPICREKEDADDQEKED
jgi:hypothetical protein